MKGLLISFVVGLLVGGRDLAGEFGDTRSRRWQPHAGKTIGRRRTEAGSRQSGSRGGSHTCAGDGGRRGTSRIAGARPEKALPAGYADAISVAARNPGTTRTQPEESRGGDHRPPTCLAANRVRGVYVSDQPIVPVSDLHSRPGVSGGWSG